MGGGSKCCGVVRCIIGNGLEEGLGCVRKLTLGEWSWGLWLKVVRNYWRLREGSGAHEKSNRLCVGGKMCGAGM